MEESNIRDITSARNYGKEKPAPTEPGKIVPFAPRLPTFDEIKAKIPAGLPKNTSFQEKTEKKAYQKVVDVLTNPHFRQALFAHFPKWHPLIEHAPAHLETMIGNPEIVHSIDGIGLLSEDARHPHERFERRMYNYGLRLKHLIQNEGFLNRLQDLQPAGADGKRKPIFTTLFRSFAKSPFPFAVYPEELQKANLPPGAEYKYDPETTRGYLTGLPKDWIESDEPRLKIDRSEKDQQEEEIFSSYMWHAKTKMGMNPKEARNWATVMTQAELRNVEEAWPFGPYTRQPAIPIHWDPVRGGPAPTPEEFRQMRKDDEADRDSRPMTSQDYVEDDEARRTRRDLRHARTVTSPSIATSNAMKMAREKGLSQGSPEYNAYIGERLAERDRPSESEVIARQKLGQIPRPTTPLTHEEMQPDVSPPSAPNWKDHLAEWHESQGLQRSFNKYNVKDIDMVNFEKTPFPLQLRLVKSPDFGAAEVTGKGDGVQTIIDATRAQARAMAEQSKARIEAAAGPPKYIPHPEYTKGIADIDAEHNAALSELNQHRHKMTADQFGQFVDRLFSQTQKKKDDLLVLYPMRPNTTGMLPRPSSE